MDEDTWNPWDERAETATNWMERSSSLWRVPARLPSRSQEPDPPTRSIRATGTIRSAPGRSSLHDRPTRITPGPRRESSAPVPYRDRSTRIVPAVRLGLPDRPTRMVPAVRRGELSDPRRGTQGRLRALQAERPTQIVPAVRPADDAPVARWVETRATTIRGALSLVLAAILIAGFVRLWTPRGLDPLGAASSALDASSAFAGVGPGSSGANAPWAASASSISILGAGGAAAPGVHAPGTAGIVVKGRTPPTPTTSAPASQAAPARPAPATSAPPSSPSSGILPAPFSPWPPRNPWMSVPGHTPYALTEPNPDYYKVAWGQCTWWAQHERPDENLRNMGNAWAWAYNAPQRGLHVGSTPVAGATAVFQPGVQGAGGYGHVAHVMVVYPDGWFLVSEMNAYVNGGGWGRVSFRYAHAGAGVSFIY